MRLRAFARAAAQGLLRRYDHSIVSNALLYDWQRPAAQASGEEFAAPADAYLSTDNPRLRELEEAYARVDGRVTTPTVWSADHVRAIELRRFRTDDAYLWQRRSRGMNEMSFALAYYYLRTVDRLGLLDRLEEDLAFGVNLHATVAGRLVTRDLLDSVAELNFLERHLAISQRAGLVMLDIGAGYGRLAYRSLAAWPTMERYLCTDAVAVSTFLCEHYLRYRGVDARARVIPLHEIQTRLRGQRVDLAINIHSFSEMPLAAIAWWMDLLRERGVPRLMVVPNAVGEDGVTMLTFDGQDFSRVLSEFGFRLVARDPKYLDPLVQKYGPYPAFHLLFESQS
jgi:putative sugar O-methyltransferase